MTRLNATILLAVLPALGLAQGQDSTTWARDLMVIAEMLPGAYSNTNQVYFDTRAGKVEDERRGPLELVVAKDDGSDATFTLAASWDRAEEPTWQVSLRLGLDDNAGLVTMTAIRGEDSCEYVWHREATQFRAALRSDCGQALFAGMILSDPQLWLSGAPEPDGARTLDYALHRARPFECYVDVPGVGGGRDLPYRRYDGFKIHDRGGQFWFTTEDDDARELGVTLFQVDWPLNNYEGIFTRDTLVIYLNERKNGQQINHGYSFTVPDADRVGINLKWALAFCYQVAGKDQKPYM